MVDLLAGTPGQTVYDVLDSYQQGNQTASENLIDAVLNPDRETVPSIIPDHLEPIGDTGFWITPDEPADPRDCARYPDSPWCGGSGLDWESILDLAPASIDPYVSTNGCETCITVDSSLFWVALPQNHICYRLPIEGCIPRREPDPPVPPPPPPGRDGGPWNWHPIPPPPGRSPCDGCAMTLRVIVYGSDSLFGNIYPSYTFVDTGSGPPLGMYSRKTWASDDDPSRSGVWEKWIVRCNGQGEFELSQFGADSPAVGFATFAGWINIPEPIPDVLQPAAVNCIPDPKPRGVSPPPPLPKRRPPVCCCKSPDDNSLEIEELLRKIARRLGVQDYPLQTPEWLLSNQGSKTKTHESLTEFNVWMMLQLDSLLGEFPVNVEIEDADPTASGNQGKQVKLPNLAEAVAEIYGLAAKSAIDSDLHTSFLMRLASEVMAAKTAAIIAQDYAMGNASFLGYKGNQVSRKVGFAFNPEKQDSLESILQSSEYRVTGWQNEDSENVADYLQKLMFSAALMKTVFFRKKSDVARIISELKSFIPTKGQDDEQAWDAFLRALNNEQSAFNKGSNAIPDIDEIQS